MTKEILTTAEAKMQKALESLKHEFSKVRSGRANASLLEGVKVPCYGSDMPLNQVASINVEDARTLSVSAWDKNLISAIEKAILTADLGLNPMTSGTNIRVPLPVLTQERRMDLVKVIKKSSEDSKIAIRNIRRDANDKVSVLLKDKQISEDDKASLTKEVQLLTDKYINLVDVALKHKEKDLMSL